MDWNDVRLIAEVGRTGSFAGAAVALGVSKPTVTRRVAYLEQTAKARIFRRGPRGAKLTFVGEQLVRRAASIETAVVDFERLVRTAGGGARPVISAKMSEGVASYLMTPALSGESVGPLGAAVTRAGLKLPAMKLLPLGAAERADISIVWTSHGELPRAGPTDKVRKLADIRFVPFSSDRYGGKRGAPRRFDELAGHRLITMSAYRSFASHSWAEWHDMAAAGGDTIVVEWSSALDVLVRGGAGVGLLPTYAPLYADRLLPLDIRTPPMFGTLWMLCADEAYQDPPVRDCFGTLGKLFKAADWMNEPA